MSQIEVSWLKGLHSLLAAALLEDPIEMSYTENTTVPIEILVSFTFSNMVARKYNTLIFNILNMHAKDNHLKVSRLRMRHNIITFSLFSTRKIEVVK